jgi:hypothetical protein
MLHAIYLLSQQGPEHLAPSLMGFIQNVTPRLTVLRDSSSYQALCDELRISAPETLPVERGVATVETSPHEQRISLALELPANPPHTDVSNRTQVVSTPEHSPIVQTSFSPSNV